MRTLAKPLSQLVDTGLTWEQILYTILIKLITNRWAWALVPTKLVEPGNAVAWGGGIHGNPASDPHQALSLSIQGNTYQPILNWPLPQEGGRDGKNQSTKWHTNNKLLQQHFVKNCKQATAYTSHEVPLLEALGHPQCGWKSSLPALL